MTATASPPGPPKTTEAKAPARSPWQLIFGLVSSMKLTVVLLLFFGVLTFAGTLAQKDIGIYQAQRDFFESFFVRWDTGVHLTDDLVVKVPLPGGYLIMLLLFVNIMVGGIVRLRWSSRNAGILVTHFGMALLLVAGFVKLHFSYAGHVALFEGRQTASMVSFHDFELALLRRDGNSIVERTIPADALTGARRGAVTIDDPQLPFVVEVTDWFDNCEPRQKGPMFDVREPVVTDDAGTQGYLARLDTRPERESNAAGCYVKVTIREGREELRGMLWGYSYRPFRERRLPLTFTAGGVEWGLDLRRVTWDLPFTVRLDKFQKTDHPGTMTPADFSSWVTVIDDGGERPVHIYMNHPLRADGHVFFQTNWGPQPRSGMRGPPWWSVFEVAKNPSDAWPKYASYVILIGLLLHFVPKLLRHLRSSSRLANLPEMS